MMTDNESSCQGFCGLALSYCFVVIIIVTGKQTNFGREKRTFRTVGWGEYGTAGVKSAPFYLKNGMSWRKMLLHKVSFI